MYHGKVHVLFDNPPIERRYMTRGMGKMCQALIEDAFPWPTCEADYRLVMANSDFFDWAWESNDAPHVAVC